jgi:hypothetical protein
VSNVLNKYMCAPYPRVIRSKTYCGYVKLRIIPNAIYNVIVPVSRNLGALTLLDPSGPAWPVMGVLFFIYNVIFL